MSDTKNHKLAIKAIIEAHRTPGKMREIMLTILADKPSAIVNAWEEVKPVEFSGASLQSCSKCFRYLSVSLMEDGVCFSCIGKKLP